ncbi:hypothetical protein TELCIR_06317 [Teladorsagia circumcincta]|uniref:Uncharacterized protein n=1 Tax=Teladorsagia circumcincta TaxID=45464 RepID=A0A2G9UNA4_TELCI|nr:hypothetical protein TELCIR_06317 [Teladorsagia circumcincta]
MAVTPWDGLEEQNSEYREKLLKTIRERDLNEELLRNLRDAQKKETSEFEKRMRDYEIQLKAVQEKANNSLRVELEQIKHEKFDLENKLKMSEKRAEILESRRMHESEELSRSQQDMERRLTEANAQCAHLSDANREANARLEEVTRENLDLMNKLQDLEDKLSLEEEAHAAASIEISRLQGIESQVLSSQKQARRAKDAQEQAEKDREVAENEAEECRQQAERMLAITEQLTERNSQLAGDVAAEREKEKDLEEATGSGQTEIASLKSELNEKIVKVQQLTQRLQEERTDNAALKKKYMASIKTVSRDEDSAQSAHASTESTAIQQVMIDKIIVLQKKLARRNDKIEFLEEHVRHCLEELQKKTKLVDLRSEISM